MAGDNKLLIEDLAEYAARNRFTFAELGRLIGLCLQLERDCPGARFAIPDGDACSVEQALERQAQSWKRPQKG